MGHTQVLRDGEVLDKSGVLTISILESYIVWGCYAPSDGGQCDLRGIVTIEPLGHSFFR